MKKIAIFGIFLALYPTISFGQTIYSLDDIQIDRKSELIYDKNHKLLTGKVVYVVEDSNKSLPQKGWSLYGQGSWSMSYRKMEVSVKNGKKDGKVICYNEDDILAKESNYKDGFLDGIQIEYDNYHPGEISQKSENKMNRCVYTVHSRDGKPEFGYKIKNNPKQQRFSKVTGLPIADSPSKDIVSCHAENSLIEHYNSDGSLSVSEDREAKTTTYYAENNRIYLYIEPVSKKFKGKADYIYTVYYENQKPMLKLAVKGDKAVVGEFFSETGQKAVLDEQKATDYLMDIALSMSLGAR